MGSVPELREEVLKLRGEGLSFSRIAKQLAISKAYAVKLAQSDRSPDSDTGHRSGHQRSLTVRQRRFISGLAEGKNQTQAALDAGASPKSAHVWASQTMRNPNVQETFAELLDRKGLSDERLAEIHAENLAATKVVAVARNMQGQITEVLEKPDFSVRQRAVKDAWVLRGRIGSNDEEGGQPVQINILVATARKVENLVGRKILPANYEPIEDGPTAGPAEEAAANPEPPSNGSDASPDGVEWGDW
jgi:phage terminase small subunit